MMGKTHSFGGWIGGYIAIAMTNTLVQPDFSIFLGSISAGVLGSLIPDIDHPESTIGRKTPIISEAVSLASGGHRGWTHSLIASFVVSLLVRIIIGHFFPKDLTLVCSLAFFIGYLSHLLLDFLSNTGIPLLLPFKKERYKIPFITIYTGGTIERIIIRPLLILVTLQMMVTAFYAYPLIDWNETQSSIIQELKNLIYRK